MPAKLLDALASEGAAAEAASRPIKIHRRRRRRFEKPKSGENKDLSLPVLLHLDKHHDEAKAKVLQPRQPRGGQQQQPRQSLWIELGAIVDNYSTVQSRVRSQLDQKAGLWSGLPSASSRPQLKIAITQTEENEAIREAAGEAALEPEAEFEASGLAASDQDLAKSCCCSFRSDELNEGESCKQSKQTQTKSLVVVQELLRDGVDHLDAEVRVNAIKTTQQ